MSLRMRNMKYDSNTGTREDFKTARKAAATVIMGSNTLRTRSAPMRNGLKRVVNLYTLLRSKDAMDAMLPVPKKAASMRNKNRAAWRRSLGMMVRVNILDFGGEGACKPRSRIIHERRQNPNTYLSFTSIGQWSSFLMRAFRSPQAVKHEPICNKKIINNKERCRGKR